MTTREEALMARYRRIQAAEQNIVTAVMQAYVLGELQPGLGAAAEELEREQQS